MPGTTASFLTNMVVGQNNQGNSLNQTLTPDSYTLQFSFLSVELDSNGNSFIPTAQAIINWKIDGQQQRRVISIVSGATISAPCSGVDVTIVDVPPPSLPSIGKKYQVQTTLTRGV